MRLALITDTHWGVRSDSVHFLDNIKRFLDEVFFPYLDEHQIKNVVHLGDLVDRRKYVNFQTANRLRKDFIEPLKEREICPYIMLGNHDIFWRESLEVNAIKELVGSNAYIVDVPTMLTENIMMIPWICEENKDEIIKSIASTTAKVLFGHLELQGFEMHRGMVANKGLDAGIFEKFEVVCSGHYHHPSHVGNITYLGAAGEFDWSDHNDLRGFSVFDTETRELEFIRNPFVMFRKVYYDDAGADGQPKINAGDDDIRGKIVKVVVKSKLNTGWFDSFISELEGMNPIDVQVVDDHLNLDLISNETITTEAKDVLEIFREYIQQADKIVRADKIDALITDLYQEAKEMS